VGHLEVTWDGNIETSYSEWDAQRLMDYISRADLRKISKDQFIKRVLEFLDKPKEKIEGFLKEKLVVKGS